MTFKEYYHGEALNEGLMDNWKKAAAAGLVALAGMLGVGKSDQPQAQEPSMPRAGASVSSEDLAKKTEEYVQHLLAKVSPQQAESGDIKGCLTNVRSALAGIRVAKDPESAHREKGNLYYHLKGLLDAVMKASSQE